MLKFKPKMAAENRRRSERSRCAGSPRSSLEPARCRATAGFPTFSDGGVRLHTEIDVPDEFTLVLPGHGGRRECQVKWRLGHEIGGSSSTGRSGFARRVVNGR